MRLTRLVIAFPAAFSLLAAGCGEPPDNNMTVEEVADQLSGMQIEPGLWELTSEVTDVRAPNLPREVQSRMIGPRSRLRHCIPPEQAARPSANFLAARGDHGCTYRDFTVAGGRVRGAMSCPDATAVMDGRYGPQAYDMGMEMRSPMPGGAVMTLQVRAKGRRLGACPEGSEGVDR